MSIQDYYESDQYRLGWDAYWSGTPFSKTYHPEWQRGWNDAAKKDQESENARFQ